MILPQGKEKEGAAARRSERGHSGKSGNGVNYDPNERFEFLSRKLEQVREMLVDVMQGIQTVKIGYKVRSTVLKRNIKTSQTTWHTSLSIWHSKYQIRASWA